MRSLRIMPVAFSLACAVAGVSPLSGQTTSECQPLETRPSTAPDYQPDFQGQTRVCGVRSDVAFDVVVLARGLTSPWSVEPLRDGSFLVSERPGGLRVVSATGQVGPQLAGVPAAQPGQYSCMCGVALSPRFDTDRTIYWAYAEPRDGGSGLSVARGVLSADRTRLDQVRVILRTRPTWSNNTNYGGRLAFGPDGFLYVTVSDRLDPAIRVQAQTLDSHIGKLLRITTDGAPAAGNPFIGRAGALPEIWSLGHRSVQALSFDAQGRLWEIEHGPRGGDELNLIRPGKNYGWPLVTFGIDYNGSRFPDALPSRPGFEPPVYYWNPVIAPSGSEFYTGSAFPAWRGSLFVGGLASRRLVRLVIRNDRVVGEEHLLADRGQRIRDVRQGPDGLLYVVTDNPNGELWRLTPRP